MKYNEDLNKTEYILDERNSVNAITLIKDIIDEDLNIEFESDDDLIKFMDSPEKFTNDKDIISKIKDLKELLDIMGSIYHV
ncbi:MAG: hypothetical protein GX309_07435 [Clostridiales bacterium]|nr:hypothetical protein [Clostridiales bacterium]